MEMEMDPTVRALAEDWLRLDVDEETRSVVQQLVHARDEQGLRRRLEKRIAFGTAGLRGPMDAGFACMNSLIVIEASQGFCVYLEDTCGKEKLSEHGIVIGFDARKNSEKFAKLTASVFLSRGYRVHLFSQTVATPILSFSVKYFGACGGIMVTASHNPKFDNGYKVYLGNGCQIIPPMDEDIATRISENLQVWPGVYEDHEAVRDQVCCTDGFEDACNAFFADIRRFSFASNFDNANTSVRAVYSAMHGIGSPFARRAVEVFGLPPLIPVAEQDDPDPEFSTVSFPNPEEKGALDLSIRKADEVGAPLILANDPDADRLAVAVREEDGWKILTGNEIAILLAEYVWVNWRDRHPDADASRVIMLASTVSSKILQGMAQVEGFVFEDTLTGFKWMGNVADQRIREGYEFLFAYEVELGFLIGDTNLDKCGVRSLSVFYEMFAALSRDGKSISQKLNEIYEKYGYFYMINKYFFCRNPVDMGAVFASLRTANNGDYKRSCGSFPVISIRDVTTGYDDAFEDKKLRLPQIPGSQMITFTFEDAVVTLRNSGTEPKLKYYVEARGSSMQEASDRAQAYEAAVIDHFLQPNVFHLERA